LDGAIARLSIALSRDDPHEVAAYIDRYRDQLMAHVSRGFLEMVEIEALINSGQLDIAEGRLGNLPPESSAQRERLSILLGAAKGENPRERLEQRFAATQSVGDLIPLVQVLRQEKDWPRLSVFAKELFARTNDVSSCTLYAQTLIASQRSEDALRFLDNHASLVERSQDLQLLLAQAAYDSGDVLRSRDAIAGLRRDGLTSQLLRVIGPRSRRSLRKSGLIASDEMRPSSFVRLS
jgi:hypothetical protein